MTTGTTPRITQDHMAVLLEAARNFAFSQMAHDDRLVPFAAFITKEGPIDCLRLEDAATQVPFGAIYDRTVAAMRDEAGKGEILACALVAAIEGGDKLIDPGFTQGLSIHLEAPDFCREVLVPFRVDPGEAAGEARLIIGNPAPYASVMLVYGVAATN